MYKDRASLKRAGDKLPVEGLHSGGLPRHNGAQRRRPQSSCAVFRGLSIVSQEGNAVGPTIGRPVLQGYGPDGDDFSFLTPNSTFPAS